MSIGTIDPVSRGTRLPPLENGDQLSRDEFERRYSAMPAHVKAELIEGVVYMASPVRIDDHAIPDSELIGWLYDYKSATPGVQTAVNGTIRLGEEDEPQPDSFLFIRPEYSGNVRKSEDGFLENAPELAIEIAASSASKDLGPKKRAYAANGIREYLVWKTLEDSIEWFVLRGDHYESLMMDAHGVIRSEVFPGLWLNVPAVLRWDSAVVKATSQQGLQSPEHARFVAELANRKKSE